MGFSAMNMTGGHTSKKKKRLQRFLKNKLVNVKDEIGVKAFLLAPSTHLSEGRLRGRSGCIEGAETC